MSTQSYKIRFLSAFLIAFVCLNAGGTVCVAYCQGFEIGKGLSTQIQPVDHCDIAGHEMPQPSVSLAKNEMDCCPMTVSIVAGPIETAKSAVTVPAAVPTENLSSPKLFTKSHFTPQTNWVYRGPPKDRRPDRIKHGVLRI